MKFIKEKALTKSTKDGAALVIARNKAMKAFKHYKTCETKPHAAILKVKMKLWPGLTINCAYSKCFIIVHYAGDVLYTVEDFHGSDVYFHVGDHGQVIHELCEAWEMGALLGVGAGPPSRPRASH